MVLLNSCQMTLPHGQTVSDLLHSIACLEFEFFCLWVYIDRTLVNRPHDTMWINYLKPLWHLVVEKQNTYHFFYAKVFGFGFLLSLLVCLFWFCFCFCFCFACMSFLMTREFLEGKSFVSFYLIAHFLCVDNVCL